MKYKKNQKLKKWTKGKSKLLVLSKCYKTCWKCLPSCQILGPAVSHIDSFTQIAQKSQKTF